MARSKGVIISVKVPINWEVLTERTKQRLRQTVGRDTRVIHAYLGIIEQYENELLIGKNRDRINDTKLDQMTLTALKVKVGSEQRISVPHDFKVRFPRISQNELNECRLSAVSLYESYLKLKQKRRRKISRPASVNSSRRIPRWMFSRRFKLFEKKTSHSRWWLEIRDAFNSSLEKRRFHDKLIIPLKISPFHHSQIERGEIKALQIFIDKSQKWWVSFAVQAEVPDFLEERFPVAILGIDLGIEKAACTTLLTPEKTRETRYFVQKDKTKLIKKYDRLVSDLQSSMHTLGNRGINTDSLSKKLRKIKSTRENISSEYDKILVRQLIDYISELSQKHTLYVAIGRLKNIRMRARKGNYQGREFRGMIHSWAFSRITDSLKHGLAQLGWTVEGKDSRFRAVPEAWTSIICWKCGAKGSRPKQNYFHCPSCGYSINADQNGSTNIAARMLMLTKSLHSVRGLGLWTRVLSKTQSPRLKAQKKEPSQGKSLLSEKELTSGSGESAAVHYAQTSLLSFGDKSGKSDDDPTVVRTMEALSVSGGDVPELQQEKEARSSGGIPSR
ncbi:MAG: transposase [Candidatus Thorarchaeota archaeon]|nr:transposase [Candidatus Thorarchaeota archaeon]